MYCKIPQKLDVSEIQSQTLPLWTDFLVLMVQTAVDCYSMEQSSDRVLEFLWDLPQYLE